MRIFKVPGPLWGTPAQRIKNVHNDLGVVLREKLLQEFQQANMFNLTLNDGKMKEKSDFEGQWQRPWTFDTEANIYEDIRNLIRLGRIEEAQSVLAALPVKTAQWYYLNGVVLWEKGWYAEGYNSIQQAINMAPENREYREALCYILRAYNPFFVLHFSKSIFKKALPLIYVILGFLCIVLLIAYFAH